MKSSLIALIAALLWSVPLCADELAVSSDGSAVVSSIGRVAYLHDAETLKVKERIRFDQQIRALVLSGDGKLLYVGHGASDIVVDIVDTETGKTLSRIDKVDRVHMGTPSAALAPSIKSNRLAVRLKEHILLLNMADGQEVSRINLKTRDIYSMSLSPDAKTLVLLSKKHGNDEEDRRESFGPHDKLEKVIEVVKYDGEGCTMTVIDAVKGEVTVKHELFYAPDTLAGGTISFTGDDRLTILTYKNLNAHLSLDGNITLFRLNHLGYGRAAATDSKFLINGSLINHGSIYDINGKETAKIDPAPPNPGFPEYYNEFAITKDGTIFGLTSDNRLFKLDSEYKMKTIEPVY